MFHTEIIKLWIKIQCPASMCIFSSTLKSQQNNLHGVAPSGNFVVHNAMVMWKICQPKGDEWASFILTYFNQSITYLGLLCNLYTVPLFLEVDLNFLLLDSEVHPLASKAGVYQYSSPCFCVCVRGCWLRELTDCQVVSSQIIHPAGTCKWMHIGAHTLTATLGKCCLSNSRIGF